MSRFTGPQHKGAMRTYREVLRAEAKERQERSSRSVAPTPEKVTVSDATYTTPKQPRVKAKERRATDDAKRTRHP